MSEQEIKKSADVGEQDVVTPETTGVDALEIRLNRATNEISFRDPNTGQAAKIRATVIDEEEEEIGPLSVEDFGNALRRIDELGLAWSADEVPLLRLKDPQAKTPFPRKEIEELQNKYPQLPHELSIVVSSIFTRRNTLADEVGGEEILAGKAAIVRELIVNQDYRSEFFYKHAIKVPYFSNIDWEVVFKLEEKNVNDMPAVAYALLSLILHDSTAEGSGQAHKLITAAVNSQQVNRLIGVLTNVRDALTRAHELTKKINERFTDRDELKEKGEPGDSQETSVG